MYANAALWFAANSCFNLWLKPKLRKLTRRRASLHLSSEEGGCPLLYLYICDLLLTIKIVKMKYPLSPPPLQYTDISLATQGRLVSRLSCLQLWTRTSTDRRVWSGNGGHSVLEMFGSSVVGQVPQLKFILKVEKDYLGRYPKSITGYLIIIASFWSYTDTMRR